MARSRTSTTGRSARSTRRPPTRPGSRPRGTPTPRPTARPPRSSPPSRSPSPPSPPASARRPAPAPPPPPPPGPPPGPAAPRRLGATLGPDEALGVASSRPVRDVESFWPVRDDGPRVLSNRGANGIDGTPSSAFGAAAADGGPVTLLIGDVALLHDLGGLLAHRRLGLDLRIVVLNNDGGGIFHFLPVREQYELFEHHVATPHGTDFAQVAALFGLPFTRASSPEDLRAPGLVEVRTEREANLALHRRLTEAMEDAVADVLT